MTFNQPTTLDSKLKKTRKTAQKTENLLETLEGVKVALDGRKR
jgi:hypothetical protein